MAKRKQFEEWKAKLDFIRGEYPFLDQPGKPVERKDLDGRLHADTGFAFISHTRCTQYNMGRKHGLDVTSFGSMTYYYENITIPPRWMLKPETITFDEVMNNPNQELRYVGLKVYGLERMVEEGRFKNIHSDQYGDLLQCTIKGVRNADLTVKYVKVVNSTPESDGTYKIYFLCVPPEIKTAREAVAWTFEKEEKNYSPIQQT